jgi:hypothetical protein
LIVSGLRSPTLDFASALAKLPHRTAAVNFIFDFLVAVFEGFGCRANHLFPYGSVGMRKNINLEYLILGEISEL